MALGLFNQFEKIKNNSEKKSSQKDLLKKLNSFIENIHFELKKEGIPVLKNGRIDMDAFSQNKIYNEKNIKYDKNMIAMIEKEWALKANITLEEAETEREHSLGDKMEKLKTVIFYKFLKDGFYVTRSSRYDDIKNGIDNIILDKKTGNIICALDEVGTTSEEKLKF